MALAVTALAASGCGKGTEKAAPDVPSKGDTKPHSAPDHAKPLDPGTVHKEPTTLAGWLELAPKTELSKLTFKLGKSDYTIDAPAGAAAAPVDGGVQITFPPQAVMEIHFGDLATLPPPTLLTTSDAALASTGADAFRFATTVTTGHRDLSATNPTPLPKSDALLLLKCARTIAVAKPLPSEPAAALEAMSATLLTRGDKVIEINLADADATRSTLALLPKFPALVDLNCSGVHAAGSAFDPLKELKGLETLTLKQTQFADGQVADLTGMTALKDLSLSGCTGITDDGVKQLAKLGALEQLDLNHTNVTDAGLEALQSLKKLKNLRIQHTKATAAGVAALKKALPDLTIDGPG
jgi:hypothetical protein